MAAAAAEATPLAGRDELERQLDEWLDERRARLTG